MKICKNCHHVIVHTGEHPDLDIEYALTQYDGWYHNFTGHITCLNMGANDVAEPSISKAVRISMESVGAIAVTGFGTHNIAAHFGEYLVTNVNTRPFLLISDALFPVYFAFVYDERDDELIEVVQLHSDVDLW